MRCWTVVALFGLCTTALLANQQSERRTRREPQVPIVSVVGCVERRGATLDEWWLTRASEPADARPGVFNRDQVADFESSAEPGTREFQLVGVADFLTAEGLLAIADRALFTAPDQANATGELLAGRQVLVKGLLIETPEVERLNLMAVVGLDGACGE